MRRPRRPSPQRIPPSPRLSSLGSIRDPKGGWSCTNGRAFRTHRPSAAVAARRQGTAGRAREMHRAPIEIHGWTPRREPDGGRGLLGLSNEKIVVVLPTGRPVQTAQVPRFAGSFIPGRPQSLHRPVGRVGPIVGAIELWPPPL